MIPNRPNRIPIRCTAKCMVSGQRITKRFTMTAGPDEDDAETLGRVYKRAHQLLCRDNGVTEEHVLVEHVLFS